MKYTTQNIEDWDFRGWMDPVTAAQSEEGAFLSTHYGLVLEVQLMRMAVITAMQTANPNLLVGGEPLVTLVGTDDPDYVVVNPSSDSIEDLFKASCQSTGSSGVSRDGDDS